MSVVAVLLAVGAGAAILLLGGGTAQAAEIRAEPVNVAGQNPFMPPVGTDRSDVEPPPSAGGSFSGNIPGLYGGTRDNAACNRDTLVAFLAENPAKAAAWAEVQGIRATEVATYVAALTPVILRADTAVTNHGYADGKPTRVDSILQAGSAVLVDSYGVPRVRCACGNPLLPARKIANAVYVGAVWVEFKVETIIIVEPAKAPVVEFVIVAPATGEHWARPTGSTGEHDRDAPPDAFDPVTDDPYAPDGTTTETTTAGPTTQPATETPADTLPEEEGNAGLAGESGTPDPTTENPTTDPDTPDPTTEPTPQDVTSEEEAAEEPTGDQVTEEDSS